MSDGVSVGCCCLSHSHIMHICTDLSRTALPSPHSLMIKWKITDRVKEQMNRFMKVGGVQGTVLCCVVCPSLTYERLCALHTYMVPPAIILLPF